MKKGINILLASFALLVVSCSSSNSTKDPVDYPEQFVGTYNVTKSLYSLDSLHYLNKYTLAITKSTDGSKVISISNISGDSITLKALVSGTTFTIVEDTINKNIYSGTGNISNSTLTISYWIYNTNNVYTNYVVSGTKN